MNKTFIISENNKDLRLDKALALLLDNKSRTYIASLIEEGNVLVNSKKEKPSYKVKLNDEINVEIPDIKPLEITKEDIPLDIIYEDDDLLIINKPQGLVVHPSIGHTSGTLVNAILFDHEDSLSGINGVSRPGIVHRIDKDTSGLICVCKNDNAHLFISEQLKSHTMHREYIALVRGVIKENNGVIDMPIARSKANRKLMAVSRDGKEATTFFRVIKRYSNHTLIECSLKTGRTHQIRVHLAYIGHPVEGDQTYAKKGDKLYKNGQLLHAYRLTLIHPTTKKEMTFEAPLPQEFEDFLKDLK